MARPIRYRTGIASVILHTRLVLEPTATTEKTMSLFWNRQRYVSLSRSIGRLWDTVTPTYGSRQKGKCQEENKVIVGRKLLQFEDYQQHIAQRKPL